MYELKVDVGMLNTVKNELADVSSVSPSSELSSAANDNNTQINTMKETTLQKQSGHKGTYRTQTIDGELYLYKKQKKVGHFLVD